MQMRFRVIIRVRVKTPHGHLPGMQSHLCVFVQYFFTSLLPSILENKEGAAEMMLQIKARHSEK